MRILLLTPFYLDLYKEIVCELKRQGHYVFVLEDKQLLPFDISERMELWKRAYIKIRQPFKKFWKNRFNELEELNSSFDLLFCIQGQSFYPELQAELKKRNPELRSVLYVWDSNKYKNYFFYKDLFDKVYTFDLQDSIDFPNVKYLPFFWVPFEDAGRRNYSLSMIGSEHDGRCAIVEKIIPQLMRADMRFYIKIVIGKPKLPKNYIKKLIYLMAKHKEFEIKMDLYKKRIQKSLFVEDVIPSEKVMRIILESDAILDTDRDIQTGVTPRVIWALAAGKKIVTTNSSIKFQPFYNEKQISIIDREDPVLDLSFLTQNNLSFPISQYIKKLRIDNWVRNFTMF